MTFRGCIVGGPVEVGDLVRAWLDNGEDEIKGRVRARGSDGKCFLRNASIDRLLQDGWNMTVIEKAPPPLPTKSGFYVAKTGETFLLDGHGDWWHLVAPPNAPTPASPAYFRILGPLTRLVPEKS